MSETAPVAISQTANVAASDRPSDKAAVGRKLPVRKRSSREKWAKRKKEALRHLWWPAHPGPDWAGSRERYDIGTRVRPTGGADTDAQAGMPARPFERSMGPGDAWEVADAWLEPHGGADELHAGVARRRGAAVPRPVCGAPRGARDSLGRAWRHLGVWRHGTIVRCAVPRAGCPGHGARTVRTPWEARPSSHLAAPFEARAIAAVMSGATAEAVASRPREADGRGRGAPARPCAQLEAHGGDAPAVPEVARDMAAPCSPGCAGAMPNASQAVDRLHVMRLAPREADRVRRAEAKSSAEGGRLPRGTRYRWPKRPGDLTGRRAARKASPMSERPLAARARAMAEAPRAARPMPDGGAGRPRARSVAGLGDALQRPADEEGRGDRAGGARGNPQLALPQVDQRRHGGDEPGHPAHEEGGPRLPRPRRLHRPDLPRARPPGVRGDLGDRLCCPLKTSKSQK